jgi:hypothetical protein
MPPGLFRHHYVAPAVLGLCGVVVLTAVADKSAHAAAAAGLATIRLTSERDILLADGKSTTIVTAEVRDDQGRVVRDGTDRPLFHDGWRLETTSAVTQNGVARGDADVRRPAGGCPGDGESRIAGRANDGGPRADRDQLSPRTSRT